MATQQRTTPVTTEEDSGHARKSYESPILIRYGAIHHATQGTGGNGNDGGGIMTKMSDEQAKVNIRKVGEHPAGFGLYLFDYKPEFQHCGAGRQFGVMAQEVEQIIPEAVSVGENGYRQVDYALLGISRTVH